MGFRRFLSASPIMKTILNYLAGLLPPYNLARLFSYTRHLEARLEQPCPVCEFREQQNGELKQELRLKENYLMGRLDAPPVHTEPREPRAKVIASRPSLSRLRKNAAANALVK